MAGISQAAPVEGIPPWPGILRSARRAMRGAADGRSWKAPLLLMLAVPVAVWALESNTGSPPPKVSPITGHQIGDIALVLGVLALGTIVFPFALGRLIGGRATLGEVFIVVLWAQVPALVARLPLEGVGLALYGAEWWSMDSWFAHPSLLFTLPAGAIVLQSIDQIVAFWCLALFVVGLSEVHGVSGWRILLLIVLPLFLLGVIAAISAAVLVARFGVPG